MSAVRTGHLVPSDEHFSKRVHSANTSNYKLVQPLAFAYNPSRINIGSIGLNESGGLVAVSPIYVVARPISVEYSFLIWHHLRTEVIREQIAGLCSGSVRQGLAAADFFSLPLVRPSEAVLRQFLATRKAIYGRIHAIEAHNSVLEELRDTLLPRLISGQLRLPEAQAATEAALGGALSV